MSIFLSLFFILLCLSSIHGSSKARHVGFDSGHKGFSTPLLHFGKGQFLFVDTFKPAVDLSTKEPVVQVKQGETIAADEEPLKGTHTSAKGTKDYSSRSSSSTKADVKVVVAVKPLVSISWSAPRKINHRDKTINHVDKTSSSNNNPRIYSDYSRPRTRPPSHS